MCCNTMCKNCGRFPAEHPQGSDEKCSGYSALAPTHDVCPRTGKPNPPVAKPPQKSRDEQMDEMYASRRRMAGEVWQPPIEQFRVRSPKEKSWITSAGIAGVLIGSI